MSLHDSMYGSSASPPLMRTFGDEGAVDIELDGSVIVTGAWAMIGPERTEEDYDDDRIVKRTRREVTLRRTEELPLQGLERNTVRAKVIIFGVRWNIEGMENRTESFVTIKAMRSMASEMSVPGFRRPT